ncbi:uncharacterized protein LOC107227333 [Neodiprion lecontei]|uniref:Uncharacterized protein LOC107227333 n=1 Tax=Neodiprion lecontei TaxID=441921 RepID=A0A6J0CBJ0_NEOLC|nr:uncharacterized protein LOC107227333 [Neodiprion lecontei]
MHIRKDHHLSDSIDITEGVLQGDILSPLLFILFIADIIKFFENRDVEGLNLNNLCQILMLLYADDIAALSHSASSSEATLKVLKEYCDINGLEVNISKTKIMACRTSGRIKKKDKGFQFKGKSIEVVKTYTYLGVALSSNLQGDIAATEASKRGKQAIGSTYLILSRLGAETWLSKKKLHDSMIKTTLLYLVHIWGLRKEILDKLEATHLLYFKRIFHLPVCTPHYLPRLELDIPHISPEVLKYAYNWVIKILDMREDRLSKLGLTRLIQLSANYKSPNLNWTLPVKSLLSLIGEEQMFEDMNATHWKVNKDRILNKYRSFLKLQDLKRYSKSESCQTPIPRSLEDSLPIYLTRGSFHTITPKLQLRVANIYSCNISTKLGVIKLKPAELCRFCHNSEKETIAHFLINSTFLSSLRSEYLQISKEVSDHLNLIIILDDHSTSGFKNLLNYLTACSELFNSITPN